MSAMSVVLILTVIAAIASLAGLVWYYRPQFEPVEPLIEEGADCRSVPLAKPTQYDLAVLELGDPELIELDPPAFAWPA